MGKAGQVTCWQAGEGEEIKGQGSGIGFSQDSPA